MIQTDVIFRNKRARDDQPGFIITFYFAIFFSVFSERLALKLALKALYVHNLYLSISLKN